MHYSKAITISDLREIARKKLPRSVFGFVDGAASDERTLRDNELDFARIRFAPRFLVDVSQRSQAITIFDRTYQSPMIFGPTGLAGIVWPDGDLELARACKALDVAFCQSTSSNAGVEQVAEANQGFWFQLYVQRDRAYSRALLQRAWDSGARVLILTVDLPIAGARERDVRNGFTMPPRIGLDNIFDYMTKLGWLWRFATGPRFTMGNLALGANGSQSLTTLTKYIASQFDASVTWKDLDWIRSEWKGHLAVKGILRPDDAVRAQQCGADGVIVSNHGGRQLDGSPSGIAALPAIAEALNGATTLIMDGGIRRGSDVVKAMALGANACIVGRAGLYGLASGGQQGVAHAISILQKEIDNTQALLGIPDLSKIDRSALFTER
jgi:L-lactate dehydrogenase (cytochrome)